ncbi:hypothetical protein SAMN06265360_1661, partial [Haloechinothrix alba]
TASSVAALREFGLVLAGAVALAFTAAHITVRLTSTQAMPPRFTPRLPRTQRERIHEAPHDGDTAD